MEDAKKTKEQLIEELEALRQEVDTLKANHPTSTDLTPQEVENYRLFAEYSTDVMMRFDKNLRLTFISPAFAHYTNSPLQQIIGLSHDDMVFHAHLKGYFESSLRHVLETGESILREFTMPVKNQITQWSWELYPLKDEDGNVDGVLTYAHDITTLVEKENSISKSREMLKNIFDSSPDAIVLMDANARVIDCNYMTLKLFGYNSVEEARGVFSFRHFSKSDVKYLRAYRKKLLRKNILRNFYYKVIRKDGTVFDAEISVSLIRDADGNPNNIVGVIKDVTERVTALRDLQEREKQLRHIVDHSSNLFYAHDINHQLTFVTQQTQEFFDCEPEEAMVHWTEFSTENPVNEDAYRATMKAIETGFQQPPYEVELVGKKGRIIWAEVYETPVVKDGKTVEIVGALVDITERKEAQQKLIESEKRIRALSDASFESIIISVDAVCIDQNRTAERMFGFTRDEAIGRTGPEWFIEQDRERVLNNMLKNVQGPYEATGLRKDGSTFPCEVQARTMEYQGRQVRISALRDITSRKVAEDALRQSEEKYRILIENQTDLIVRVDPEGRFEFASPSYCELFGKTEEDLLGTKFIPFVHEDDREPTKQAFERSFHPPYKEYMEQRAKTIRGWRWLAWLDTAILDNDKNVIAIIGVGRDITDRKMAEEALRDSEERYKGIFNSSPIGIFHYNRIGVIIDCNNRFIEIIGATKDVLVGMNMYERLNDQVLLEEISNSLHTGTGHYEGMYRSVTGNKTTPVRVHLKAIRNDNGEIVSGIGMVEDVTEQKKLEEQLRQAQKIESIGHLAGGIAHDFNNLLTPIFGNTEMILQSMQKDDRDYVELEEILDTAERARDLVKQLLAFSRKQVLQLKMVNLTKLIKEFRPILRRTIREDIEMNYEMSESELVLSIDPVQMEQVLMNLCINAQDAMPQGGNVTITTEETIIAEGIKNRGLKAGKYAKLVVTDNGVGIEKRVLTKIFDPFFTTKELGRGTGLGLSTVHGIVKQHHGDIQVTSKPNRGTKFTILLPISVEKDSTEIKPKGKKTSYEGTETIFVIEDEPSVKRMAVKILTKRGYNVYSAENPDEAAFMLENIHDKIDLLLTDVVMPRTNGIHFYNQIRENYPSMKALFMSGYPSDVVRKQGIDETKFKFLQKPFTIETLLQHVREALDSA
ncbi:PAS domain S-box protein [bacterium]|nr:PAS domain S-box protein [bacterium]